MNSERRRITCRQFEEERALYHLSDAEILHCTFAGATDGESALKEARQITVSDSTFALRYPLWHVRKLSLDHCRFQETARAALWYCEQGSLESCELHGIKALRECHDFRIAHSIIDSEEFGWKCKNIRMTDCKLRSEYLFFDSRNIELQQIAMTGKYCWKKRAPVRWTACCLISAFPVRSWTHRSAASATTRTRPWICGWTGAAARPRRTS